MLLPDKKTNPILLISAIAFAASLAFVSADGLFILFRQWIRMLEYWRFLILPVSLYFVWRSRKELKSLSIRPNFYLGIPLVLAGCAAYVAWRVMFVDFFIEVGLFVLVLGSIMLVLGIRFSRVFLFPLLYLVLMTSIVGIILGPITEYMQHLSAIFTAQFLNSAGWPVLREGRFIRLPQMVLEVARECSGTGQLTALIAFALPLGILMHRSLVSRLALVGLTIPIALFVNTLRIILIAIWNYESPQAAIHGPYEILRMPIIHPIALLMLFLCSLGFTWLEKKYKAGPVAPKANPGLEKAASFPVIRTACFIGFLCIVAAISGTWFFKPGKTKFIHRLEEFPMNVSGYSGTPAAGSGISFYMGKPDAVVERKYRNTAGNEILLYIGRFDRQNVGKRITSLESGLASGEARIMNISVDSAGTHIPVKISQSDIDNRHFTTISWFEINNNACATYTAVRKKLARAAVSPGPKRNNAALVALSVENTDKEAGLDLLSEFTKKIYPEIREILEIRKDLPKQ